MSQSDQTLLAGVLLTLSAFYLMIWFGRSKEPRSPLWAVLAVVLAAVGIGWTAYAAF